MRDIFHALVLNMHQPPSNLDDLLATNAWEAKEILFAYDRMPRMLWGYEDVARVHLSLSGTLLETLSHPDFQKRVYGIVDCGTMLWFLQNQRIFDILGTGYYHPVFALTPEADWDEQIGRWQAIGRHIFWRSHFAGFWPPEMAFDERMIPHLKKAGYRYVFVDSEYVRPIESMSWQELRYRPHICEYGGAEIVVVVRDRELSAAQLSGMDYGWFYHELHERTKFCDFPPLVTTATDGDNGGWFRNVNPKSNFWSYFYTAALDDIRAGHSSLRPIFITEYLDRFGAHGRVRIERGAWDTGDHHGWDFTQWQGGEAQRDTMARVQEVSADFHRLAAAASRFKDTDPEVRRLLDTAHWHLLRAETSCNFFWGDAWLYKTHKDLDAAAWHLGEARPFLKEALVEASVPAEEAVAPSLPPAETAGVETTAGVDAKEPPPA
ncbi:Glycoside hydrolase family 57 [Candidatus Defluviicoccus seviourii]|uniref:Glycoside hydrolase family 57 n=1 Tax=Candidatus Defluviicoccus seviourii TaxID=2565273 RepID=A0A564WFZ7_9PROT|nr:Glycoside hydrolase family 57 [Candidatus Defluviicoccus seviourii]